MPNDHAADHLDLTRSLPYRAPRQVCTLHNRPRLTPGVEDTQRGSYQAFIPFPRRPEIRMKSISMPCLALSPLPYGRQSPASELANLSH